ncbi:hypothetical protein PG990_005089 [Apiospora arundinis]|uniref:Uncharacterized protein n=1 Tax=Apiospora arundinis TaxID=335852 RepID=A0ABR2J6X1_9PEZI
MPVTIKVATHGARGVKGSSTGGLTSSSWRLLKEAASSEASEMDHIVQTSLPDDLLSKSHVTPSTNGFVESAWFAYSNHHNLVIRPDDVWFAILVQFSFYVNANSEILRDKFVSFEGKRALLLQEEFVDRIDFGSMSRNMTQLIEQNIVDPELRMWILPSFTTTTVADETVAAVLMMGTLQKYFEYMYDPCTCGIPWVTLLGEKSDYEDILQRLEKLKEYGEQPRRWYTLLRPVLRYMIATFERPADDPVMLDFWKRIIQKSGGSGSTTMTGWMMAFSFWDEDGKAMGRTMEPGPLFESIKRAFSTLPPTLSSELDEVYYHEIEIAEMPAGWASVPVTVLGSGKQHKTKMVAGSVGIAVTEGPESLNATPDSSTTGAEEVKATRTSLFKRFWKRLPPAPAKAAAATDKLDTSARGNAEPKTGELNTMQSLSGWWMYAIADGIINSGKDEFVHKKVTEECQAGLSIGRVRPSGKVESVLIPTEELTKQKLNQFIT